MTPREVGALTLGQLRAFVAHMERVAQATPGPSPQSGGGPSRVSGDTTRQSFRNPNPRAHTTPQGR